MPSVYRRYQVRAVLPIARQPAAWDLLRRLGLRAPRLVWMVAPGQALVCHAAKLIACHPDDLPRLRDLAKDDPDRWDPLNERSRQYDAVRNLPIDVKTLAALCQRVNVERVRRAAAID